MRLLEHQAKRVISGYGVSVPRGHLWGRGTVPAPCVLKAQVPVGGRGKAGGIVTVEHANDLEEAVEHLIATRIGGHTPSAVYVEEYVPCVHEWYLAITLDRARQATIIMATRHGGVDVENGGQGPPCVEVLDPFVGLQPFHKRSIAAALSPDDPVRWPAISRFLERLYRAYLSEDALLVEVNPLGVRDDGTLVALDVKMILDDDAAFRHPQRSLSPGDDGTAFELAVRRLGGVGVEMDGSVAILSNGAGLTMATLDQVISHGASVAGLVELHGALAQGPEGLAQLIVAMGLLRPEVVLLNAHYQFRPAPVLAEGLALALSLDGEMLRLPASRIVTRLRGVGQREAEEKVRKLGCVVEADLDDACSIAASISLGSRPRSGGALS